MAMIDYGCIAKVNDNAHIDGNAWVYGDAKSIWKCNYKW